MALAIEEQASGGLPQFDPSSFESQLVWLVITMLLLYVVISRMAIPRVGKVLEAREDHISANLDKAARDRQEAEDVNAQLQQVLNTARQNARTAIADAKTEAAAKIAAEAARVDSELLARIEAAEKSVAAAKSTALADLKPVAQAAAVTLVSRIAGDSGDEAAIAQAVEAALSAGKGVN